MRLGGGDTRIVKGPGKGAGVKAKDVAAAPRAVPTVKK
jgi:hypothetical protein